MPGRPAHLAIAATALAGCGFSASFDGGRFRCDSDQNCPDGLSCSAEGYCEAGGEDAGPPVDAGATEACGTTDALRESFEDPALFHRFWTDDSSAGASADSNDGVLTLTLQIGDAAWAGRKSSRWYRLQDSGLEFRLLDPPEGNARLALVLTFAGGTAVRLSVRQGTVEAARDDGDGFVTVGSAELDPVTQPLWRVREVGGELLFELGGETTSSWTELATMRDIPAEPVEVGFYLSDGQMRADGVAATIDDLNPRTTGHLCAASSLTDDFDGGGPGLAWATWNYGTCEFAEVDGALRFRNMGEVYNDCGYRSLAGYDMTGDTVDIEVPTADPDSGALNFTLFIDDEHRFLIRLEAGASTVVAQASDGGTVEVGSQSYSPDTIRYWRMVHERDTGLLRFLFSRDAATWSELGATEGTNLENVKIVLYASDHASGDGAVAFDRLNLVAR